MKGVGITSRILLAALLTGWTTPAPAQSCPAVTEIDESLRAYDGQRPIFRGLIYGGVAILELWASENEWTSVMVLPNGQACILDEGAFWMLPERIEGDPA